MWAALVAAVALQACATPAPATAEDMVAAERAVGRWFAAVSDGDCDTLIGLSRTGMTAVQCVQEVRILQERGLRLLAAEDVHPDPTEPGAVEVQCRVGEGGSSETIVNLTVVPTGGRWVVSF